MTLADALASTCAALTRHGFRDLLAHVTDGALDLAAPDLPAELLKHLDTVDRSVPGFEDYAPDGVRAIEPGRPAQSLLYHAVASACVSRLPDGTPLRGFPTPAQIDVVENAVFGLAPPRLEEVVARADGELAVVVFALEYRPGLRTPHRRHADLCFARTGIARVGTAAASYDGATRQFEPLDASDPFAFRVQPVRYAPFLATRRTGVPGELPHRHVVGDETRHFWVPLHKLFPGADCLAGLELDVELAAAHLNEKLRRFHQTLGADGYDTGWGGSAALDEPPFRFRDGIAELSTAPEHGTGLLVPVVHDRLVEPATYAGAPLGFTVPADLRPAHAASTVLDRYFSSLEILPGGPYAIQPGDMVPTGRAHASPEYVNARHVLEGDGTVTNLNDRPDVKDVVAAGGYRALHFVDFSGDGWIEARCPQLDATVSRRVAAYSIVAAPDFFPYCDQLELLEWWEELPAVVREGMWAVLPLPLSDTRLPPNVTLEGSGFDVGGDGLDDTTVTAVVTISSSSAVPPGRSPEPSVRVRSTLPDGASGVFDPGWDVTTDALQPTTDASRTGPLFLAGHGLGAPFVEDAKICAALGTYWPAASPDSTRTYQPDPYWPTISPLTDEEIGVVGDLAWDGIQGPRRLPPTPDGPALVEYLDIDYADYVDQALDRRLTAVRTSRIDAKEYTRRVEALAWIYWALGLRLPAAEDEKGAPRTFNKRLQLLLFEKARWNVLSFRRCDDPACEPWASEATAATGVVIEGSPLYAALLYRHGADRPSPDSFRYRHVEISEEVRCLTDLRSVCLARDGAPWDAATIPTS